MNEQHCPWPNSPCRHSLTTAEWRLEFILPLIPSQLPEHKPLSQVHIHTSHPSEFSYPSSTTLKIHDSGAVVLRHFYTVVHHLKCLSNQIAAVLQVKNLDRATWDQVAISLATPLQSSTGSAKSDSRRKSGSNEHTNRSNSLQS